MAATRSPEGSAAPAEPARSAPRRLYLVVFSVGVSTLGAEIAAALRERAPEVVVTRLASGLPVGADLEYADEVTLGKALVGRRAL